MINSNEIDAPVYKSLSIMYCHCTILIFQMYCQGETLPIVLNSPPRLNNSETIKAFTDITQLTTFLTDTRFEFTKDEELADIIWCKKVFKDFR